MLLGEGQPIGGLPGLVELDVEYLLGELAYGVDGDTMVLRVALNFAPGGAVLPGPSQVNGDAVDDGGQFAAEKLVSKLGA